MQRFFTTAALLAAVAAAAAGCTDTEPTGPRIRPDAIGPSLSTETAVGYVDRLIPRLFPKGLETSTGKRWTHIKETRRAGDAEMAAKHMRDLVKYVKLKTADIENLQVAGDEVKFTSQAQAAASLSFAMAKYAHQGETAVAPQTGGDVAFEVVPAGEAAIVRTPSERAAVDIPAGATSEDRLITIIQHPNEAYPGNCNGPLPTKFCQYPLFYDISSFPSIDFNVRIGVSVCASTFGTRSPLDPAPPAPDAVHDRLALARPYTGGAQTVGGKVMGQIEVLPARAPEQQKHLTHCETVPTPVALAPPRGGLLGRAQRGMLAIANFAGQILTPKSAYAIDAGPEHWTIGLGSPVNSVDTASVPDLSAEVQPVAGQSTVVAGQSINVSYTVENASPRNGGDATASSEQVNGRFTLRPEGATTGGTLLHTVIIPALAPDGREEETISIPIAETILGGRYVLVFDVDANDAGGGVELASVQGDLPLPEFSDENNSASFNVTVATVLNYPSFTSLQGLSLAGNSSGLTGTGAMRLTDALDGRSGAFWSTKPMYVRDGFETTFAFQIASPSDGGADGLAFVVRASGSAPIGDGGGGIGYDGIAPSLAVEFDTWHNSEHQDPNAHHLSIRTQNAARSTAFLFNNPLGGQLDNGATHTVTITYLNGTLSVRLDGVSVASVSVSLPAGLLDANGRASVGFTASTGAASESHHILSWFFRAPPAPPPIIN